MPTIDNIWPNDDQTEWSFEYAWNENVNWSLATYPSPDDVPPLPDWDDIADFLDTPFVADSIATMEATYGMIFNGQKTAGGGVTAQNLESASMSMVPTRR